MDKVLVTGENGSCKSSLLSALKYAFLENPHPKDPFRNAPAAHLDAITGAPIVPGSANPGQAAPFERPQFAGSNFGGGSNGLPF